MRDITVSGKQEREALPLIDAGLQVAKLYCIADVGKHYDERYGKTKEELVFIWELPDFRIDIEKDGEKVNLPRAISRTYTKSLNEKANLRKDLQSWRGKAFTEAELEAFSLSTVLGKTCQLNIIHNPSKAGDKTYANIDAVLPAPRGCQHETPENKVLMWGPGDNESLVPKWVFEKASTSLDGAASVDRGYEEGMGFEDKAARARALLKGATAVQSSLALMSADEAKGICVAVYEEVGEDKDAFVAGVERAVNAKNDGVEETRSDLDESVELPF